MMDFFLLRLMLQFCIYDEKCQALNSLIHKVWTPMGNWCGLIPKVTKLLLISLVAGKWPGPVFLSESPAVSQGSGLGLGCPSGAKSQPTIDCFSGCH